MLKIPKGLKKKKKGKKSKRKGEEELFTEEELEKYRKEHSSQQAQVQVAQQVEYDSDQEPAEKPKTDNDEWSKFNALTTGIDSVLKKTQGDLDRIKSTSFFQRVATGPKLVDRTGKDLPLKRDSTKEGQRWVGFEEGKAQATGTKQEVSTTSEQSFKVEEFPTATPTEFHQSETESEEEEDFDDIFDTSYVEAVEKGEVKLAYIPDSPEEVVDDGPDPFDTTYAEKVIKGPEVSKKGKKLVNIGVAVEVLTGRLDNVSPSAAVVKKAKRRIPRDLLFENADPEEVEVEVDEPANALCLLDEGPDITQDVPVDLSVSLHTQYIKKPLEEPADNLEDKHNDILTTFDTLKQDDDDDEFAQIASESLSKPVVSEYPITSVLPTEPILDDLSWAAFEESKGKPSRPPPPRPSSGPSVKEVETKNFAAADPVSPTEFDDGPDPFDTTFAENILPGKAEIKTLEEEFLTSNPIPHSDSDFDFNPREGEKPYIDNRRQSSVHIHITDPTGVRESISEFDHGDTGDIGGLKPLHRDLLGGSSTDLTQLADSPIAPTQDQSELDFSDPFDTSIANNISAPGKTELKFIEDELLGQTSLKNSLSDPEFDPRAEENAEAYKSSPRKPSRPENLLVNKTVIFKIPPEGTDFLDADKSNKKKPVTPYYAREASITDEEVNTSEDTFEASNDSNNTGKSILKNSQTGAVQLTRSTSDQDLNAEEESFNEKTFSQLRRHSDFPINFKKNFDIESIQKKRTDFLSITEEESVDTKVLTPYQEKTDSFDIETDPFDTSIVSSVLLPGKTELKVLESELLAKDLEDDFDPRKEDKPKQVQDLLEPSDDCFQVKALTPEIPEAATGFLLDTEDDIDPFDTSFADNLGPGKTELKLLESELMN